VLYLLKEQAVRPLYPLSGESGRRFAKPGRLNRPDSPDYPQTVLMASQIYSALSLVGGPDTRYTPANSFPLTLSWQWHVIESDRTEFSPSREKERVVAVVELPAILGASGSKSQGGVQ